MIDVEFRVVSERREGLLLALGQVIAANGFTLLRHSALNSDEGTVLKMTARGPVEQLLVLEDALGTHAQVRSFESSRGDDFAHRGPRANLGATPARQAAPALARAPAVAPVDSQRIEILLSQLARGYPNILLQLVALERDLPPTQREPTLRYIGHRVGAWVYKRDFALGGQLPLADSVRRIALPAMRQLLQTDLREGALYVRNSPFCHRNSPGECCHFLRGMLGGLLEGQHGAHVHVVESQCRNTGAETCRFEFLT